MNELSKYIVAEDGVIDATDRKYFAGLHVGSNEAEDSGVAVTVTDGEDGAVVFSMNIPGSGTGQIFPTSAVQFPNGIYVTVSGDAYATLLVA